MKMLRQVQQMQDKMSKVQAELEMDTVEASAGGGAVRVVASGTQKVVSVTIDPEAASDTEMLQDLVVAAVNEAMEKSKQLAASKMQAVASGLGLPPGLLWPLTMPQLPEPLERLIQELSRLPGIGPKTAQRLAFHLLRTDRQRAASLAHAIE